MASKFVVLATVLVACNAGPIWITELPGTIMRVGRAPSISYGFGSGFSSNIGGLSQSSGFGTAFNSGDGVAYGAGLGESDGNNNFARGVGIASSGNAYPIYQAYPTYNIPRSSYGNTIAAAQNFGGFNTARSSANTAGGQAVSSAQTFRGLGYETAISSANNGYGSAISAASNNGYGNSNSISSARIAGHGYNSQAVSASERHGPYEASSAQTVQQRGNAVQNSGATSINGPGIQAAHSHAVQTGFY